MHETVGNNLKMCCLALNKIGVVICLDIQIYFVNVNNFSTNVFIVIMVWQLRPHYKKVIPLQARCGPEGG